MATTSNGERRLGRVPTYDANEIEVWIVPNPHSSFGTYAVELRIVGERGGVQGRALLSDFGVSKLGEHLDGAVEFL